jgi:two-component system sensor histidine kinase/response regulator
MAGPEETRLRAAIDAAHDAYVVIDERSRVIDWNPAAERLFGWSREEVLGIPITETIIPPWFRGPHRRGMQRFLATGHAPVTERKLRLPALTKAGQEIPVELSISAVRTDSRYTFAAFVQDISERRSAELEDARKRVSRTWAERRP